MRARALLIAMFAVSATACAHHVEIAPHTTAIAVAPKTPPRAMLEVAAASSQAPEACAPIDESKIAPLDLDTSVIKAEVPAIVDPERSLDAFYAKLISVSRARGEAGDRTIRIGVYGDSNMTRDFITGELRRALQSRFGDAGHGFVALARPWGWYRHMDVRHDLGPSKLWINYATSTHHARDGYYGFANIAAESWYRGATTWVETANDDAPVGTRASAFDIYYLKRPKGGDFEIVIDDAVAKRISTRADEFEAGFEKFDLDDAPHKLSCVTKGGGPVRLFGVTMERTDGGVIVDSLGTGALNYEQMLHVDRKTRREMLAHRGYDVVAFLLGTNMFAPDRHARWVKSVLTDFHAALPNAAIVIMSPPDSGMTTKNWTSNPRLQKLQTQMRDIAEENGAAFWDFYAAMGGKGSIKTLVQHKLAERDCIHFSREGGAAMGDRFANALFVGAREYATAHEACRAGSSNTGK